MGRWEMFTEKSSLGEGALNHKLKPFCTRLLGAHTSLHLQSSKDAALIRGRERSPPARQIGPLLLIFSSQMGKQRQREAWYRWGEPGSASHSGPKSTRSHDILRRRRDW